jgi:putative transposase
VQNRGRVVPGLSRSSPAAISIFEVAATRGRARLMARLPRLAVAGLPHLIEQRSHNGQPIFAEAADVAEYRVALGQAARSVGVAVHAYRIQGTRALILATPIDHAEALSRMVQQLGRRYTAAFNRRHGRTGTLWDGRFRAAVIDPDEYLIQCMRHIEGEASSIELDSSRPAVACTSLAHHVGESVDPVVADHPLFWSLGNTPFDRQAAYRLLVAQPLSAELRARIDAAVQGGWPLGSERFLAALAQHVPRRVRPGRPGRPRAAKAAGT